MLPFDGHRQLFGFMLKDRGYHAAFSFIKNTATNQNDKSVFLGNISDAAAL